MRRRLSTFTILISVFCIILLAVNLYEIHWLQNEHMQYHHHHSEESSKQNDRVESTKPFTLASNEKSPKFVAFGRDINSGFLKHVFYTFEHFGYLRDDINSTDDWDVLWAHDYPFTKLRPKMLALKPYQRVNHFPGSGFITNKQDLATSGIKYVPKAFKIPEQTKQLQDYVSKNPQKMFVQKSNDHRGIKIEKLEKLNLKQNGSFVQEFVDKPLLVDGHKFDIGVYTIITSVDPLTVYIYNGDILFRYCPVKYYPFDPKVLDKYVVGDDYLPTWEVPSLKEYFNDYGYNMRDSFNAYIRKTDEI